MSTTLRDIRILIVDDHRQVREGFAFFFGNCPNMSVAGEASNGIEAIVQFKRLQPDAVLMDVVMPVMDGIEATRLLHQEYPDIVIIALTGFDDEALANTVVEAGALRCLSKSTNLLELLEIIRTSITMMRESANSA